MQSGSTQNKKPLELLADKISTAITNHLYFEFQHGSFKYVSISNTLKYLIIDECRNILTQMPMLDTHRYILENANLNALSRSISGERKNHIEARKSPEKNKKGKRLNLTTQTTTYTYTGLCEVYHQALSDRTSALSNLENMYEYKLDGQYCISSQDVLREDEKSNTLIRTQAIVLAFRKQLLLLATPEQARVLHAELEQDKKNILSAVEKLPVLPTAGNFSHEWRALAQYHSLLWHVALLPGLFHNAITSISRGSNNTRPVSSPPLLPDLPDELWVCILGFFSTPEKLQLLRTAPGINRETNTSKTKLFQSSPQKENLAPLSPCKPKTQLCITPSRHPKSS